MRKTIILRHGGPPRQARPGGRASKRQVQEFVRLYLEVEPEARHILARLVRHSSARPHPSHVFH